MLNPYVSTLSVIFQKIEIFNKIHEILLLTDILILISYILPSKLSL
jgi:hypothetical protein